MASAWRLITFVVMGVAGVGVLVALILTLGEALRRLPGVAAYRLDPRDD